MIPSHKNSVPLINKGKAHFIRLKKNTHIFQMCLNANFRNWVNTLSCWHLASTFGNTVRACTFLQQSNQKMKAKSWQECHKIIFNKKQYKNNLFYKTKISQGNEIYLFETLIQELLDFFRNWLSWMKDEIYLTLRIKLKYFYWLLNLRSGLI